MQSLIQLLQYYANGESNQKVIEVKPLANTQNNNEDSTINNSRDTRYFVAPQTSSWYLYPFYSPTVIHNHYHHHHRNYQTSSQKTDSNKNDRDLVGGVLLAIVTGTIGYVGASAYLKYNRIVEDEEKYSETLINVMNATVIIRRINKLLAKFKSNRLWSLCNQGTIFFSCLGLTTSLILPAPQLVVPCTAAIAFAIISAGIRCGIWSSKQERLRVEAKALIQELSQLQERPPEYNPN